MASLLPVVSSSPSPQLGPAELAQRSRPGPRYTSYPTANHFKADFGPDQASAALADMAASADDSPIGLYVHIPFCPSLCWYCGCNVTVTRDKRTGSNYVDLLDAELALLGERLGGRKVGQLSLGGGSPNFLTDEDLTRLVEAIDRRIGLEPGGELHAELDPRRTSVTQVETLAQLGFTRLSVGVQDFAPEVQDAIHRHQTLDQTAVVVGAARDSGFTSINLDLIYGLPLQTPARFAATLDQVLMLHPDRMAFFGYAHLPAQRPHQKLVERAGPLPDSKARAELLLLALERSRAAGYVRIGIDHVAVPDDELVQAAARGTLDRNFQGYVARRVPFTLGVGATAVSDAGDAYWQNHHELEEWTTAVRAGRLPVERGVALTDEDRLRRFVIMRLMCDGRIDASAVEDRFRIDFEDHFAGELATLAGGTDADLASWDPETRVLQATPMGELLIRNVCMAFDRHLPAPGAGPIRHAPTV